MSDHGAILEVLSRHALITGRRPFVTKWLPTIVKACEYIVQACAVTEHDGVKGLLPPGHSTDEGSENQGFISQAYTYKGLMSAVQLLEREKHPRAKEFKTFGEKFRSTFVAALHELADRSPKWTDADGNQWPAFKPYFSGTGSWDNFTMFDSGALISVWAGLMPADDPLMRSFVQFFRSGPNTHLFDAVHHNALDWAILDHEQSSSEPCYSWNMFHNWQLGDREHYLEGMYGLITGGLSTDTFVSSEHRNAIYGNVFSQPIITWSLIHAVIDDDLVPGELQLLRFCPQAWLSSAEKTVFENVPTQYGPVTLRFGLDRRGNLDISVKGRWHQKPPKIVITPPPLPGVRSATVNGRSAQPGRKVVL